MSDTNSQSIPEMYSKDIAALPKQLRELLQAEVAIGNRIVEVGHTFPAPPAGAYFMLANQVSTRPRANEDEVRFYERNNSQYDGEFTDAKRHYFILESPRPAPPPPDMDAIRAALTPPPFVPDTREQDTALSVVDRFEKSREMTYDKWREGEGYDLDALRAIPDATRRQLQHSFIPAKDWRDIEVLIELKTDEARDALKAAAQSDQPEMRLAVYSRAPELFDETSLTATLLMAIDSAVPFSGLSETLDAVQDFHPIVIQEAMFDALLSRSGDIAYHMATSLAVIHGKISSRFDWSLRPAMLQFNTTDSAERARAYLALYDLLDIANKPEFSTATSTAKRLQHFRQ